jgi:hypothetical protein
MSRTALPNEFRTQFIPFKVIDFAILVILKNMALQNKSILEFPLIREVKIIISKIEVLFPLDRCEWGF